LPYLASSAALPTPAQALHQGHWVKLICGASYHFTPAIRDLALVYTLAGVDCIDVAADPAIVAAARAGVDQALALAPSFPRAIGRPWLMVSLNDGADPHFRKAQFDPRCCPADCPRPCETVCPALAIPARPPTPDAGVLTDLCYGCGRCLPICPHGYITAQSQPVATTALAAQVLPLVDALEIHTQVGRATALGQLVQAVTPWWSDLQAISISCPYASGVVEYLQTLYPLVQPHGGTLIWQTDGRPMSGDLGRGATRAAITYARQALVAALPGYVQLAGGTNHHTAPRLRELGLISPAPGPTVAGIAYGSHARKLVLPWMMPAPTAEEAPSLDLVQQPRQLQAAVAAAQGLVATLKPDPPYS